MGNRNLQHIIMSQKMKHSAKLNPNSKIDINTNSLNFGENRSQINTNLSQSQKRSRITNRFGNRLNLNYGNNPFSMGK